MGGLRTAAAVLAFAACVATAAARTSAGQHRRLLHEGWENVTVVNRCNSPVTFKAAYNFFIGVDEGHPCPNQSPGASKEFDACTTDWETIQPDEKIEISELPDLLWSYSAYVEDTSPAVFISRDATDAALADADNFNTECVEEQDGECVWWAVPELKKNGTRLVLRCPQIDDAAAPAPAPAELPIELINNCSSAVQAKVAYTIADGESTDNCTFNVWRSSEVHICITDWLTLEAGEARDIASTQDTYWVYGARIADDPSYDLTKSLSGAFQATNETLACPEKDAYGEGYICEWWAPSFISGTEPTPGPITISCDGYTA